MTSNILISTPFELPFSVWLPPLPVFSEPFNGTFIVELDGEPSARAIDRIDGCVRAFLLAVDAGAFGGSMVAPWKGSGGDLGDPVRWGKTLQWPLRDVLADDFSLVCLVHLLAAAHEEAAICRISMRGQVGPEPGRAFDLGSPPKEPTYPGRWSGIEFAIVDDHSQSDAFELQLTFKREPTEKEREELESDLALWLAVTISGAFAEYPKTPAESFLVADEPKWDDDLTLAWYFEKVRVHEAAFDSLINVCASIDHRLVPISALNFA